MSVCVCVRACVRAGESVSARVLCLSVCQFHFALYDAVSLCAVMYYCML